MHSAAQSRRTPPLKSISPIEKPKSRKFRQAPSPSSLRLFTPAAFRHRWQKNSRVPICRVSRSSPLPCTADAPMKTLLSNSTICAKKQKLRFWPAPRRLLRMFLCPIWSAAVPTKTTSLKSATSDAASAKNTPQETNRLLSFPAIVPTARPTKPLLCLKPTQPCAANAVCVLPLAQLAQLTRRIRPRQISTSVSTVCVA